MVEPTTALTTIAKSVGPAVARRVYEWSKGSEARQLVSRLRREHPAADHMLVQPECLRELWFFSSTGVFDRDAILAAVRQVESDDHAAQALVDAIEAHQWSVVPKDRQLHFELLHLRHDLRQHADAGSRTVLERVEALAASLTPQLAPLRQLPPINLAFIDRVRELDEACEQVRGSRAQRQAAAVLVTFDGMPGSGKSATAIEAAHRLAAEFPDAQLYADLRVPDRGMRSTVEVASFFLRQLGVEDGSIPAADDGRFALLRSVLAERSVMILLDNVTNETQIRPLLPATSECVVLATSRRSLAGLESAHRIAVDVLAPEDALMLVTKLGEREETSPEELDSAREIAALCGYLPLALRVTAAFLRRHPERTMRSYCERLREERSRLDHLVDAEANVRASVELSYQELTPPEAALLRHAAALVVGGLDREIADVLADQASEHLLDGLAEAQLLQPGGNGDYRLHELVRLYGREAARAAANKSEFEQADRRLAEYLAAAARMRADQLRDPDAD